MKALNYSVGAIGLAALLAGGAQVATAASLGAVQFAQFTAGGSPATFDLGGVRADTADALITWNDYNGAATLPGGLPNLYSIHIDRAFYGDGNDATADQVYDKHWFKIDPATMNGASTSWADASLNIVTGYDTGMDNVVFMLYEANETTGEWVGGGAPIGVVNGEGQMEVTGLAPDHIYLMRVYGSLRTAPSATNVGRYDIVLGLTPDAVLTPIPVPPALLLLLTGLGALFGFGRARKAA